MVLCNIIIFTLFHAISKWSFISPSFYFFCQEIKLTSNIFLYRIGLSLPAVDLLPLSLFNFFSFMKIFLKIYSWQGAPIWPLQNLLCLFCLNYLKHHKIMFLDLFSFIYIRLNHTFTINRSFLTRYSLTTVHNIQIYSWTSQWIGHLFCSF